MEREEIARYLLDFQERELPELISRELGINLTKDASISRMRSSFIRYTSFPIP